MKQTMLQRAAEYIKAYKGKKRWYKVLTCLAAVVVFCTTYALILPAITLENEQCQIPEHTHTEACYTQVTSVTKKVPICTEESLNLHKHTKDCKNEDGEYICGYADFVVHEHDDSCYDEDGNLWCPLPEIKTHTHSDSCYSKAETASAHEHTDECYEWKRGELICGEEEREGHTHDDSCYDADGNLICGKEEDPGHQHTDECYEKVKGELTCKLSTEAVKTEPKLTCTKKEIILHEHSDSCFDGNGNLVCDKMEVVKHVHSEECFQTEETETTSLTCGMEEHVHTAACNLSDNGEEEATAEGTEETTDTEISNGSNLPVQGTAYASPGVMMFSLLQPMADSASLDVMAYVTDAVLSYRNDSGSEWIQVGDTPISGNADLRLDINYEGAVG